MRWIKANYFSLAAILTSGKTKKVSQPKNDTLLFLIEGEDGYYYIIRVISKGDELEIEFADKTYHTWKSVMSDFVDEAY